MGNALFNTSLGGMVAVLQGQWPTALTWPEVVRSILMVSALSHNVDDSQLSSNGGVDEEDGAGVPVAQNIKYIIDKGNLRTFTLPPSQFSYNQYDPGVLFTLQPGERYVLPYFGCIVVKTISRF